MFGVFVIALGSKRRTKERIVLVVDDEKDIRDSLKQLLAYSHPEATVLTAKDASDAMGVLEHRRVDLVITDFWMPGMDGLELLERVRQRAPMTRMGLITAFEPESARHDALQRLDFFLRKPIHVDEFIEAAGRTLD